MKYYKLLMDMTGKNDIVCHYRDNFGMQEFDLCIGQKFYDWKDDFSFYYDQEEGNRATDFLANDMSWFVVSEKLKTVLDALNTKIQYFKVKITEKSTEQPLENYYVANIISLVNALCIENSTYFKTQINGIGTVYSISKYAIYEDKANGFDIFKLTGHQEIPIFVSEKFRIMILDQKITGMEFLEIETV